MTAPNPYAAPSATVADIPPDASNPEQVAGTVVVRSRHADESRPVRFTQR